MNTAIDPKAMIGASPDDRVMRRAAARATLGVSGREATEPLGPILKAHGLTTYPIIALGLLTIADSFQAQAFSIMTPEISRSLGMGLGAIGAARTLAFIAAIIAPLPMAALAQRPGRRALLCVVTGIAWSAITLTSGFVTSFVALVAVLVLDGLSTGSVAALHQPMLVDAYPPNARVRVLSMYTAFGAFTGILSPLLVALLAGPLDLSWRGTFVALGFVSLGMSLFSLWLRDPKMGRFDTDAVRAEERQAMAANGSGVSDTVDLGFFEVLRRVLLIPTVRRLGAGFFAVGVLIVPFATFLSVFLEQRWGLSPGERGVFFSAVSAVSIIGLVVFGRRAESEFARDPSRILAAAGVALAGCVGFICLGALMPFFLGMCAMFALGQTMLAVITPSLGASLMSILDARHRPHAAAIIGIFTASGSILGVLFLSGIDRRFGVAGAIVALLIPGLIAGAIVASARKLINADLDRMIDEILEAEDVSILRSSGTQLPMLSCSGIDFSYGPLQVLFDVDFSVDEGEMVALLGTNGAGKSTLLKVISGIGLPSKGSVRMQGQAITYLDAERRVPMGITQIPGGKAVFGSLDVVENLRLYGYTLGRDKRRVDEAIDECFDAFPRLYERRGSLASTMSGGEQQMLALSKALILRPKVLLIDELSLGLAPIIVGQLLEMVRRINQTGTAVVLVEQSVNIALSLVNHAYFMEKGQMRFDGPAQELLHREDLLRAVFLEGAEKHSGAAK